MISLGSAWYPEHWPTSQWTTDLKLMAEAGMNVVRVGEFAWSRLEPTELQFNFDWLEQSIALAAQYGMQVVLGTPTAAPPAWLTQRYPETLAIRANGQTASHGMRCHYSPASTVYQHFCQRIVEEMAKCFGHNPHVIGWQIDNEYNSVSYDADTQRQFQAWLKTRFGTLDALAEHWALAYWSEDYSDWSQIPLPIGNHNPGLLLAFNQFITHVYRQFQRVQIDAIRKYSRPDQWITHNFMKWFDTFDHYPLAADLDIVSWDNYIPTGHLDFQENGAVHDLIRGLKHKNFWLMETQPGQVNWGQINTTLDRGEVRTMAWHAIGHGADAILYWQWRSAVGGQEQMHGTLVAPNGKPRPVYHEIKQIAADLAKVQSILEKSTVVAAIAILHTYEDRWAINFQRHHKGFDPVAHLLNYYRPLRAIGHTVDIVHPSTNLANYKLIIAPTLNIADMEAADRLLAYVHTGGHLVLGARSAVKDKFNALLTVDQPGPFAKSLGAHVADYYALEQPVSVGGQLGSGTASIWAEQLVIDSPDTQVLLSYGASNGWLDGQPTVVTRVVGAGRITYVGAWLNDALMEKLSTWLLTTSNTLASWPEIPKNVELCTRIDADGQPLYILINHARHEQAIALPQNFQEALTNQKYELQIVLPPLEIAVLKKY